MAGPEPQIERRLAAILAADVAGFSSLMEQSEEDTFARIQSLRREVIEPSILRHHGRLVKSTGDGFLMEFGSPVEAVRCALAIQTAVTEQEAGRTSGNAIRLRIGINLGDVIVESDGDIYGDGVNVAARLEGLSDLGGICISGAVHDYVEGKVDATFEDRGEQQVKNMSRPVRIYALKGADQVQQMMTARPPALPDKPSIAVLPFENLGQDREGDFLADGAVDEIIAALSRIRAFFVIARNSTLAYKGRNVGVQQVSQDLGVRYVLEGRVRRAGQRVRITAQLVDAATGVHLWGNRYEGAVDNVFDFQDEITASVVGAIQPSIRAAEIERAKRKRPDNLDAYDLVMRSFPLIWAYDQASNAAATDLLVKALTVDPTYPLALSLLAWSSAQRVFYGWSQNVEADKFQMREKARAAVDIAPDDPFALMVMGTAYTISRELQGARMMIEQALALDPNSAWAWNRSGWVYTYLGDGDTAVDHFLRAIRLSPFDPMLFMSYAGVGAAHFVAGRYSEAVAWDEKALLAHPRAAFIHRVLAPAYVYCGKQAEAEASVRHLLAAYPATTVTSVRAAHLFRPDVLERLCEGLRLAGLPE